MNSTIEPSRVAARSAKENAYDSEASEMVNSTDPKKKESRRVLQEFLTEVQYYHEKQFSKPKMVQNAQQWMLKYTNTKRLWC